MEEVNREIGNYNNMLNAMVDICMEYLEGMKLFQTEQPMSNSIEVLPGFCITGLRNVNKAKWS